MKPVNACLLVCLSCCTVVDFVEVDLSVLVYIRGVDTLGQMLRDGYRTRVRDYGFCSN